MTAHLPLRCASRSTLAPSPASSSSGSMSRIYKFEVEYSSQFAPLGASMISGVGVAHLYDVSYEIR